MVKHKQNRDSLICFAGCDWWYQNRGLFVPQIMSRLTHRYKVLFVNSLGVRIPSFKQDRRALNKIVRKLKSFARFLRKDPCGMYVLSPISVPFQNPILKAINSRFLSFQLWLVKQFLGIREPIYYIGCLPAWDIVKTRPKSMLIYERTDVFEEMPGGDRTTLSQINEEILRTADLVLYVNRELMRQGNMIRDNGILIGHGVDYDRFASPGNDMIPEDIQSIPKPIVGFFGDINSDVVDVGLLEHICRSMPEISLVLIGPVSSDISRLRSYPNAFILGKKPYEQIPHYGRQFDAAIMPWIQNEWIRLCNPVKLKEYLALGLPVVSVRYPELEPYRDMVYSAGDYSEFIGHIREALNEKDPGQRHRRQQVVSQETWDRKAEMIMAAIENTGSRTHD